MLAVAIAVPAGVASADRVQPDAVDKPSAPVVTAIGQSGGATVSWSLPQNNGSTVTKYVVATYLGQALKSTKSVTCAKPCTPARTLTLSALTNGKLYTFKVAAVNAKGTGPSGATTIKVSASGVKPGAPSKPKATGGPGFATVSWTAPANGSATISGYTITPYRAGVAQKSIAVKPSTSRRTFGLTAGQSYVFRISAKNAVGRGPVSAATNAVVPTAPPPSSMDALGDSLTAGWNDCGSFKPCPEASWSTGTTVNSHYKRILAKNPAISGHTFNEAVAGQPMSALAAQVNKAISHHVGYVTILMGGNDVCKANESQMTPVATFQSLFHQALDTLTTGLPNAKILVVSIPDLLQIWALSKDNPAAPAAWASFPCQSVFGNPTSTDQADVDRRARVRQRVIDDNTALAAECALHSTCVYDNNAVFQHQWTTAEISTVDYIHPNPTGQNTLATLTYTHGYNW